MIQVKGVTKYYGQRLAVKDISFEIMQGRVVGLLGPNGAGKTTILRILTCYLPPTEGSVLVAGIDSQKDPLGIREKIGFMPENVPLYGDMSVLQFLGFVADSKGIAARDRRYEISKVISQCGLEQQEKRLIRHLSKGQRQRVGLAQALLGNPQILILDEPTAGLDPAQVLEIRQLVVELGKEKTVLLSTHILPEASQVCNEVIILNNGRLIAQGTLSELREKLKRSEEMRFFVRTNADFKTMLELKNENFVVDVNEKQKGEYEILLKPEVDASGKLSKTIVEKGISLFELRSMELSLEEIFVRLLIYEDGHTN